MERQSAGVRSKLSLVAVMLLGSVGCVAVDSFVLEAGMLPGAEPAAQVVAMWCNQVATTPDSAHNGEPLKGLASPRLRIRPLQPAPSPLAVGIAYGKKFRSTTTDNFIEAARLANAG